MPRSKGSWKEVGLDTSPPRPPPTDRAALEMVMGRRTGMINRHKAERQKQYERLWANCEPFRDWVLTFMLDEPTKAEMEAGKREVLRWSNKV